MNKQDMYFQYQEIKSFVDSIRSNIGTDSYWENTITDYFNDEPVDKDKVIDILTEQNMKVTKLGELLGDIIEELKEDK